jgi:hypothetical protein
MGRQADDTGQQQCEDSGSSSADITLFKGAAEVPS